MALYEVCTAPVTFGDDQEFTVHLTEGALVDLTDEQANELGDAVRKMRTDDLPTEGREADQRATNVVPVEHSVPAGPAAVNDARSAEGVGVEHSTPAGGVEVAPDPAEVAPEGPATRSASRRPKGNAQD